MIAMVSKQVQAENRVTADAYTRCHYLLMGRELVGQGRNDEEAVDPEHDLYNEGRQGGSSCRIRGQGNEVRHDASSTASHFFPYCRAWKRVKRGSILSTVFTIG
jgi:hypothetical protein